MLLVLNINIWYYNFNLFTFKFEINSIILSSRSERNFHKLVIPMHEAYLIDFGSFISHCNGYLISKYSSAYSEINIFRVQVVMKRDRRAV